VHVTSLFAYNDALVTVAAAAAAVIDEAADIRPDIKQFQESFT